ncbi:hypothetical protein FOPG_20030 [Fusarium oxysporum f. sp. conglutinans race 2 54008]|uniref:Uncharacterized protein n=1 Tax=Fusarium oxysporum f. sp. conglutinans race 2 54008 TaxID=1089457 RepID=X0GJ61_FUSOX|nr:hypothetical protein FOPG_20030 [Fusarium oxysporum f. sp. conglutinans race 2 54008]
MRSLAGTHISDFTKSRVFAAKAVDEKAFWQYLDVREQQTTKWEELYGFANFFCDALKRRHDAKEHHASLDVGLCLDIGVSKLTSNGAFFVNERYPVLLSRLDVQYYLDDKLQDL